MPINHWPDNEKPREKLLKNGSQALTDAELFAIIIRTGIKGANAIEISRNLLIKHGSLRTLFTTPVKTICNCKGIGLAKAIQIHAALELGRRLAQEKLIKSGALTSPDQCEDYLRAWFSDKSNECFVCVYLDAKNQIIDCQQVFTGTINQVSVYPREIARLSLEKHACSVIVAHNHPSGIAEPSAADIALTKRLKSSLDLLEIRLLDHLIIGEFQMISLAQRGEM